MNYGEAIVEDLQPFPVRRTLIERQCLKHGLSILDEATDEKAIALCVIEILTQMLSVNNIGEGGVSISFNKEGVESVIKRKCNEFGFDSSNYIKESRVIRLDD